MIFFPTNSMLSFYLELFQNTDDAQYLVNVFAAIYGLLGFVSNI